MMNSSLLDRVRSLVFSLFHRYKRFALNIVIALFSLAVSIGLLEFAASRWNQAHTPPIVLPPNSTFDYRQAEFAYSVETNALGFRGPEVAMQRPPERCRIVVIGDSFTYGAGLSDEQTWPHLLETQLRDRGLNVEVLNLGKPGAGPAEYVIAAERGVVLQPDLVMVMPLQLDDLLVADAVVEYARTEYISPAWDFVPARWLGNNLPQISILTYSVPRQVDAESYVANRQEAARALLESAPDDKLARFDALDEEIKAYLMEGLISPAQINRALTDPQTFTRLYTDDVYLREKVEAFAEKLTTIQDLFNPIPVALIPMPYRTSIDADTLYGLHRLGYDTLPAMYETDRADEAFRSAASQAGVPFLSVTDKFRGYRGDGPLFYALDAHLTPAGSRLFADALLTQAEPMIRESCGAP